MHAHKIDVCCMLVRAVVPIGMADTPHSFGFGNAHPTRERSKLGLGAARNPHDWHGFRLDMVGLSLLLSRHASRDVLARWRSASRCVYVHRNVVVRRSAGGCFFVAIASLLVGVVVVGEAAGRGRIGGCSSGAGRSSVACGCSRLVVRGRTQDVLGVVACIRSSDDGCCNLVGPAYGIGVCF